jgi:HEAT repeat protein
VYGVHIRHIEYDSDWGRHLVTLCRLTFDFLLIQGIVRLLAIRESIRDAVAAVKKDRTLAVRLGRRAIGPLILALQDQDERVRQSAAAALGMLRDARAVEPLLPLLQDQDPSVREWVANALKRLDPAAAAKAGVT